MKELTDIVYFESNFGDYGHPFLMFANDHKLSGRIVQTLTELELSLNKDLFGRVYLVGVNDTETAAYAVDIIRNFDHRPSNIILFSRDYKMERIARELNAMHMNKNDGFRQVLDYAKDYIGKIRLLEAQLGH